MKRFKLKTLINNFLLFLETRGYSSFTLRNYQMYLNFFTKWLKTRSLDEKSINDYLLFLSTLKLTTASRNNYLIALRSFLDFLAKKNIHTVSQEKIELAKTPERQVNFLTSSQVNKIIDAVKTKKPIGLRNRAILELLFATGLRLSELCGLKRNQIDLNKQEFTIIGKGGRARLIFLSERAKFWLEKYLKTRKDDFSSLFISSSKRKTGKGLGSRSIQKIVWRYAQKAEIPIRVTPHMFRHAFACDILTNSGNLRLVQELLGHKNISTTQIYTHLTNSELKKDYFKFHSGNRT